MAQHKSNPGQLLNGENTTGRRQTHIRQETSSFFQNLPQAAETCGKTADVPPDVSSRLSFATLVDPASVKTHHAVAKPSHGIMSKIAFPLVFLAIGMMLAAVFGSILKINNGTFTYTLDDPYIHLALSDQIRHGNYGLHPGTHAAPSSSILFPFLLALGSGSAFHPYMPLLINVCAVFFTVELMRRFLLHLGLGQDNFAIVVEASALVLMAACFNIVGVAFTGLEHSLHIVTVAAIIYGLALFLDRSVMPVWLPAAIIAGPLIRYEGIALSVATLFVLALRGRGRIALVTFTLMASCLVSFSWFLTTLGLPPLPSSILMKSSVAASGIKAGHESLLAMISKNADSMTTHSTGLLLLLAAVAACCICATELFIKPRTLTSRGMMALVLVSTVAGQAVAGRLGWLERYEDYMVVSTAMICIYLAQSVIREALAPARKDRLVLVIAAAASLMIAGARYWETTVRLPLAANNIYEQQMQMHRFVDGFYRGPVAVNDLGLISYHNPYPVLDLGGLGSEEARLLIASHANAAAYEALVAANGVHLVIVYQEWFPGSIPDSWQRVGTMSLSREALSAAQAEVQFYATDDTTAVRVRQELAAFQGTLPAGVGLTID